MVILSTNRKNTKKMGKNCLYEDDVGKKMFAETYMFIKMFPEKKNFHSPFQKNNGPSLNTKKDLYC